MRTLEDECYVIKKGLLSQLYCQYCNICHGEIQSNVTHHTIQYFYFVLSYIACLCYPYMYIESTNSMIVRCVKCHVRQLVVAESEFCQSYHMTCRYSTLKLKQIVTIVGCNVNSNVFQLQLCCTSQFM